MKDIDDLEFDCFEFNDISKGSGLPYLLGHLFNRYNLYDSLNIDPLILRNFAKKVEGGFIKEFYLKMKIIYNRYLNNPYHNKIHSFDVTQVYLLL